MGIAWAFRSAVARTLDDYSEATGHDAALQGFMRHTLFRDRLDRVFADGRYLVDDGDPSSGVDLLHDGLTARDVETMPILVPALVRRADLNKSPGWSFGDVRFLIASSPFGEIDQLPWPKKSSTKQQVATQPNPDPDPSLFDGVAPGEPGSLPAATEVGLLDLDTYVVAHSLDSVSGEVELVLGRPRFNEGGGSAWFWRISLLDEPPSMPTTRDATPDLPGPHDDVPDAPVRLRLPAAKKAE